jgi:GT2 family glycosyltransferase
LTRISVVIPTYRRAPVLRQTLDGLAAVEGPSEIEVVVVDNAGDDQTERVVREARSDGLNVALSVATRRGAAHARNEGARLGTGDYLLFLDDDMIPRRPDMVQLHLDTQARYERALVAGDWRYHPTTLEAFESTPFGRWRVELEEGWRLGRVAAELDDRCINVNTVSASNFSIAAELFWSLDGFDERYPYAGAEDQDFSMRAVHAGCSLILNRDIQVDHNETWLDFNQFCLRQERGAHSVVHLVRAFPDELTRGDFYRENWPVSPDDPPRRVIKKTVKSVCSRELPLRLLRHGVRAAERTRAPERLLRRVYAAIVGLHTFKGVRDALDTQAQVADHDEPSPRPGTRRAD